MDKLKQWVALTVVACVAIVAAGWFLLVSPQRSEAADVRAQAASQDTANGTLRTKLRILQTQAKDLPKKQADLARVAAKIPSDPALPALIRALSTASTAAGVQLVSVTPGQPEAIVAAVAAAPAKKAPATKKPPANKGAGATKAPAPSAPPAAPVGGALARIPVTINVVGGYFEVAQFMASLENLSRALRVTDLAILPGLSPTAPEQPGSDDTLEDGRSLTTTITGSVFMAANRPAATPVVAPTASAK